MADVSIAGHKYSPWMVGAIVVGGGVAIYYVYKQRQSSSTSSASSTSASAIDPLTGLPTSEDNQTDPLTGETYLGEAQQYGSVSAAEQALSGTGIAGSYYDSYGAYGSGGYGYGTYTGTPLTTANEVPGTTYASNAAWAQAVETGLTDIGYASTDVSAALGRYLADLTVTSAQASIIEAAIAEYGPPPVGTFQVHLQSSTGATGSGSGSSSGSGSTSSARLSAPQQVHAQAFSSGNQRSARVSWDPVKGATGYTAECRQGGANGQVVSGPFNVSGTDANFGNLKPKTSYTALIWPGDGSSTEQPHAQVSFTTN